MIKTTGINSISTPFISRPCILAFMIYNGSFYASFTIIVLH